MPLDVLTPTPLRRKVLRVLLVLCVLPLLPLLLPLLALVTPCLLCLGGTWLAVTRPSLLRAAPRDFAFITRLIAATRQLNRRLSSSRGHFTTADYWAEVVQRHGPKEALVFGRASYTYAEVDVESDRMALWAVGEGLAASSTVALLCANRPERAPPSMLALSTSQIRPRPLCSAAHACYPPHPTTPRRSRPLLLARSEQGGRRHDTAQHGAARRLSPARAAPVQRTRRPL